MVIFELREQRRKGELIAPSFKLVANFFNRLGDQRRKGVQEF